MSKNRVLAGGITVLTLAAVAVALLYVTVGTANADSAIVIKNDGLCGMPGSDASGNQIFGGIGTVTTLVENGNKVMIKCKGTGITNLSGSGQSFDGFGCGIIDPNGNFFFTTDSHATVSASGVGTLTCTATF
jgi:hypothetical protein